MNPYLIIAALIGLAVSFCAGWRTKSAFDAEADSEAQKAVQASIDAFHQQESRVAATLETKLSALQANQTVVERETLKIVDRPVYNVQCLDADGLRLIEAARSGNAGATKPAGEMSGSPKPAQRH